MTVETNAVAITFHGDTNGTEGACLKEVRPVWERSRGSFVAIDPIQA